MLIQVNTDRNIPGHEALVQSVEETVKRELSRYSDRITRIEVHLSDVNSTTRGGATDMRCLLEARLAGRQPIAASEQSETVEQAVVGAARRMPNLIESELGRLDTR